MLEIIVLCEEEWMKLGWLWEKIHGIKSFLCGFWFCGKSSNFGEFSHLKNFLSSRKNFVILDFFCHFGKFSHLGKISSSQNYFVILVNSVILEKFRHLRFFRHFGKFSHLRKIQSSQSGNSKNIFILLTLISHILLQSI